MPHNPIPPHNLARRSVPLAPEQIHANGSEAVLGGEGAQDEVLTRGVAGVLFDEVGGEALMAGKCGVQRGWCGGGGVEGKHLFG